MTYKINKEGKGTHKIVQKKHKKTQKNPDKWAGTQKGKKSA